jgi:hypothetical protein
MQASSTAHTIACRAAGWRPPFIGAFKAALMSAIPVGNGGCGVGDILR